MSIKVRVSAYGAPALQELTGIVGAQKASDPLAPVVVMVPSNLAGIVARRHLATGVAGRAGIAGIDILTLPRLADQLAGPKLAGRRPATRPVTAAAWRRILADNPGSFTDIASHPATVRALIDTYDELRDLSATARTAVAESSQFAAEIVAMCDGVRERLKPQWYDATDVLDSAAEALLTSPSSLPADTAVVLYLPQALTRAERAFVQAIGVQHELTIIAGATGVQRADAAVFQSVAELATMSPAKAAVPTAATVHTSSDADDEVRCAVRKVVESLQTTPAHRVAVLYTSAVPYARLLHEHFAAAGVSINGPGVRSVDERAIGRVFLDLLALADNGVPRADAFQVLSSVPIRDRAGKRVPAAKWERVSRAAGVVQGNDWTTRLDAHGALLEGAVAAEQGSDEPREWFIQRRQRELADAQALQAFIADLEADLDALRTASTWSALSYLSLSVFERYIGGPALLRALPADEQYAAAAVVSSLQAMGGLDDIDTNPSFDTLRDALELELTHAAARVGRFGTGMLVAPVSAGVGLDVDLVYVLGLSEDLYPGRIRPDALLSAQARESTPELRSPRERIDAQHRQLLAAFAAGRTGAHASFARGDLRRSTGRLPSRFLLSSLRELCGDHALPATEWESANYPAGTVTSSGSFAGELLSTPSVATGQEWRSRAVSAGLSIEDPVIAAGVDLLAHRDSDAFTRFDGDLRDLPGLPDYAHDDESISPTALENYVDCPHSYFVARLLNVRPIEAPESIVQIQAKDVGNLIHQSVEALITEYAGGLPSFGEPWDAEQASRFVEIVRETADFYESRGLTGHPRLWRIERDRVLADAARLIAEDSRWRGEVNARVAASELAFGMHGEPPVEVPIDGGRVLMRGSADRVDVGQDGTIYVTDIKTGGSSSFRDIKEGNPLAGASKLQLPTYAYAARQAFGDATTTVRSAYWFVRRGQERIQVDLTPQLEAAFADALGVLAESIAQGLFPLRPPPGDDFGWVRCAYCNPDGISYVDSRRRWVRKRADPALASLLGLIEPGGAG